VIDIIYRLTDYDRLDRLLGWFDRLGWFGWFDRLNFDRLNFDRLNFLHFTPQILNVRLIYHSAINTAIMLYPHGGDIAFYH
jgi:hypothetical protein